MTFRSAVFTALVTSGLAAGGATGAAAAEDRDQTFETITLDLRNAGPRPLRCVAVLAHFVTRELAPVGPEQSLEIELRRRPASGELAFGFLGDRPMWLENLLCGHADDWASSYGDAPVLEIRSAPRRHFAISCGFEEPFSCVIEPAGE